jgi:perosamine synthetase
VIELGALPVLVDVDPEHWNLSVEAVRAALTPQTRAIIAIDQFGCPAPSSAIQRAFPELPLIVDAACSIGSHDGDKPCAARGVIACMSFHPRKLLTVDEGGMCLTDDAELAQRLRQLRNHGQAQPGEFARASGNYRLSEVAAAIGCVQLGRLDGMLAERRRLAQRYRSALQALTPQRWPAGTLGNDQTFGVVLPPHLDRDASVAALRERGIESGRLSYALHTLPQFAAAAQRAQAAGRPFPQAERLAQSGLALPLWVGLSEAEQSHVIESLEHVLGL